MFWFLPSPLLVSLKGKAEKKQESESCSEERNSTPEKSLRQNTQD
jgi:hypothetical protein